jgi:hypothetical protein
MNGMLDEKTANMMIHMYSAKADELMKEETI